MITYNTNMMGPINIKWYRDRGLTETVTQKLESVFVANRLGKKVGDDWEVERITTSYSGGRIDIRDSEKEGHEAWSAYGLAPMHGADWSALSIFLWNLTTETQLSYNELIEQFEAHYGKQIRWAEEKNWWYNMSEQL